MVKVETAGTIGGSNEGKITPVSQFIHRKLDVSLNLGPLDKRS
jgi:hypothetical protein